MPSQQDIFLGRIDTYLADEAKKDPAWNIASHEAGGALRIAFWHNRLRPNAALEAYMGSVLRARRAWAVAKYHHGFPDEAEVHHEIETFLYFQNAMLYWNLPGADVAAESIVDVAEHVGNWVTGIPEWYDWKAGEFRSVFLGTRTVRAAAPFDYQEANHWRFISVALAAHHATRDPRYLDVAISYANRWTKHIEQFAGTGMIPCSILPAGVSAGEMGYSGNREAQASGYKVFYSSVAANTAFDVFTGLTDVWRHTRDPRHLHAAQAILDQFFSHATDGRPATHFKEGRWVVRAYGPDTPSDLDNLLLQEPCFLTRMAIRHDLLTGDSRYRGPMMRWAEAMDESQHVCDATAADVMAAAHYYTGDQRYLERGFAMANRALDLTAHDDAPNMCSKKNRYGVMFLVEGMYLALCGTMDVGTRGGIPLGAGFAEPKRAVTATDAP